MEQVLSRFERAKREHMQQKGSPFVCVTWAQSLDGYIAASPGIQTIISCNESMRMTHELRSANDSILVGIGTVLSDNPRLNARLSRSLKSPRPIILDSLLRTPPSAKFLQIPRKTWPIVFTSAHARSSVIDSISFTDRSAALADLVNVREVQCQGIGKGLNFNSILTDLANIKVQSIMVEGGSKVLTSVLDSGRADYVIVTVAPRMFGDGVPAFRRTQNEGTSLCSPLPDVINASWDKVGSDIVLSGIPENRKHAMNQ